MELLDYFDEFVAELRAQLEEDQKEWGDTWKKRPREGQVERTFARLKDYRDKFENAGLPFNWLKAVGNMFIGWVRDKYPDCADR